MLSTKQSEVIGPEKQFSATGSVKTTFEGTGKGVIVHLDGALIITSTDVADKTADGSSSLHSVFTHFWESTLVHTQC